MSDTFNCGKCGLPGVTGIYCETCRALLPPPSPRSMLCPGQTIRVSYRGTIKDAVVEKVGRVNVQCLIMVNNETKQKLIRVPLDRIEETA